MSEIELVDGMYNPLDDELIYSIVWEKTRSYNLTDKQIKELYVHKFYDEDREEPGSINHSGITYRKNSHGYRSDEFLNAADLVTMGCEYTYGLGIENEADVWGSVVAREFGWSHANLGKIGSSVGSQIRELYMYIKKFGKPKYLLALFPNFYRFQFPENEYLLINSKNRSDTDKDYLKISSQVPDKLLVKYSAQPHLASAVITEEIRHFYAAQEISNLEAYCKEAGIEFLWATLVPEQEVLIHYLRSIDLNFFYRFIEFNADNSHSAHNTNGQKVPSDKYKSADWMNKDEHIRWAEIVIDQIKKHRWSND